MGIYPFNAAANAIIWLPTEVPVSEGADPRDGVLACATEIRKSMGRLKDPMFIKDMMTDLAKIQSQVAWDKSGQDTTSALEGCMIVNSTWK